MLNRHDWDIISSKLIEAYFKSNSIVSHQLDSYNNFVHHGLYEIFAQEPSIKIDDYVLTFDQPVLGRTEIIQEDRSTRLIYPNDARQLNLNYTAPLYCRITESYCKDSAGVNNRVYKEYSRIPIGDIPIMLKSSICNLYSLNESEHVQKGECMHDPGGYFIIKGNERVLVAQIRSVYNKVFVSERSNMAKKPNPRTKYIASVRPMSNETSHSVSLQAVLDIDERNVSFVLPNIKGNIPAGIVFKGLGFTNEHHIKHLLRLTDKKAEKFVRFILNDALICDTQDKALHYIASHATNPVPEERKIAFAKQIVQHELVPSYGIIPSPFDIALFLGHMIRQLVYTSLNLRKQDDLDNYANKRIESAGNLLFDIFRHLYKKFLLAIRGQLEKRKQRGDILTMISRVSVISKGLHNCLATGNWSVQKNATYMRTGVSQVLDRMTYCSALSHLRRVSIPVGRKGKNVAIRQLHPTSFGFICPCETPEGQKIGTVINLALTCKISKRLSNIDVKRVLETFDSIIESSSIKEERYSKLSNLTPVFFNGVIYGLTADPEGVIEQVKSKRLLGIFDAETSVTYDSIDDIVYIFSDEGRFIRPLLTVNTNNNLNLKLTSQIIRELRGGNSPQKAGYVWDFLVKRGYVQYVDPAEIENSVIAMYPSMLKLQTCQFCEIHPSMMFGLVAALTPFPDHNQSPRNCYQASMLKQALGIPLLSYNVRADTMLHVMHYSQKPIICTKMANVLGINEMPNGANVIMAITGYGGFQQEDGLAICINAVQKGLFLLTTYHTIEATEKKRDSYSFEEICLPPLTGENNFKRKNANYSLLDERGVVRARYPDGRAVIVRKGDVIISKVLVSGNKTGQETRTDISVLVGNGEEGVVDKVYYHIIPSGFKLVKVLIRNTRIPEVGDKFAYRCAQKGTVGKFYAAEDMPFTASGMIPDVLVSSLCISSRMTVSLLLEAILGKNCVIKGEYGDCTPFTSKSITLADDIVKDNKELMSDFKKALASYGLNSHGWEKTYCGFTGEEIEAEMFIGPIYYQRLKHLVVNKLHARAKGAVTSLCRQATLGRSQDGGLRIGEMERDAIAAAGNSRFLKERLYEVSDPFQIAVCQGCGTIVTSLKFCQSCGSDRIVKCNLPYASKLLFSELSALGMKLAIKAGEK
jgi:DNA-directed RNA polymerase II subunit RPB2